MNNHKHLDTEALRDWLKSSQCEGTSLQELAQALHIPYATLQEWMMLPFPHVDLEHIQRIADYRQWSIEKVMHWLGIEPMEATNQRRC